MRKAFTALALILLSLSAKAQLINDYSLIGMSYGVTFSNMFYNPSKHNRAYVINPNYVSVSYTKYSKMFDSLPYFGLVLGASKGNQGFAFKQDSETGYTQVIDEAEWGSIDLYELYSMAQIHADAEPLKFMANVGVYGGWRDRITRRGPNLAPEFTNAFRDYENQLDYGLLGGAGIALMFDPIEIHFNCYISWSWSSLYDPDYYSKVYYRYAYPMDIIATVGVHFQLSKRHGKTRAQIKKQAYDTVYGKQTTDTQSTNR